jgi:DNA-binding XRE family transcriptional regulator
LKRYGIYLEMTQTEFAEKLEITHATVNRIEKGRSLPSLEVLLRAARFSKKRTTGFYTEI